MCTDAQIAVDASCAVVQNDADFPGPGPASPFGHEPGSHASQQAPAWVPPPDPVMVDQFGLVGHFADDAQSRKPPHAELLKLQPGPC